MPISAAELFGDQPQMWVWSAIGIMYVASCKRFTTMLKQGKFKNKQTVLMWLQLEST